MLTLLLLRHAKSDWGDPGLRDHDRPLARRGRRDARRMGQWLAANGLTPRAAVSSTARRATETARLVLEAAGAGADRLRLDASLYGAGPGEILRAAASGEGSPLLLVGHNPGMEFLVGRLGIPETGAGKLFPTAALAVVRVGGKAWRELPAASLAIDHLVRPRDPDVASLEVHPGG